MSQPDDADGPVRRAGYPFRFRCRRSGNCCARPEGFVRVLDEEVAPMAAWLGLSPSAFRSRFMAAGGILKQGFGTRCVFLLDGPETTCTIHPVRPDRCRSWPFWEENIVSKQALLDAATRCPGIELDPKPSQQS